MSEITKKKKPVSKKTAKPEKQKAVAFFNWEVPLKSGGTYRCDKGFPIFQNPEYPSSKEDWLIDLAKKHGGSVELTMRVRINLNNGAVEAPSLDDVVIG